MATYAELAAEYKRRLAAGQSGQVFLKNHPKFAETYARAQAKKAAKNPTPTPTPTGDVEEGMPSDTNLPPEPVTRAPDGFEYVWDGRQYVLQPIAATAEEPIEDFPPGWTKDEDGNWVEIEDEAEEAAFDNDLFQEWRTALEQFGFTGTDVDDFLAQGLREGWTTATRTIKMRQQDWYLAAHGGLFAANLERSRQGKTFLAEQQVLDHAANVRSLVRQYGYSDVPDSYIALSLTSKANDPSQILAQMNHQLQVQQRVNLMGGGVAEVYRAVLGRDPSDQDLYELFDPTIDTSDVENAIRQAEYRGRPMLLGLGIRGVEEARALEMLGISPDQAFEGYKKLAGALPTIDRLAAIDQAIANDPQNPFDSFGALFNDIFRSDPKAQEAILLMAAREQARFRQGGVQATQGQLTGLLTDEQKASYS